MEKVASPPLISILVPFYNDAAYLDQTLDSISVQTIGDFEVVMSDDCGNDGSVDIAIRWMKADSRFRLIQNPSNLGMTKNWNRALKEARGRYVVKLDADDIMRPRFLEILSQELEQNTGVLCAYCRCLSCDENLEPFASYLGDRAFVQKGLEPLQSYRQSGHNWFKISFFDVQLWHSNAQMHRRDRLLAMGGWDESWGCASDTDLILRVLEQNKMISHLPYVGIYYRHRESSVSDTFTKNGWLTWEGTLISLLALSRYYAQKGQLNWDLRYNWWRIWRNWVSIQKTQPTLVDTFPGHLRTNLIQAAATVSPPPLQVLIPMTLKYYVWRVKNWL